jgi:hypothetical protein
MSEVKSLSEKITGRIDEVFAEGTLWKSPEIGPLPIGDPHIQDFLALSDG